jgi:hypothetical protein
MRMQPIIAQLRGDVGIGPGMFECSALGVTARGAAPVIKLCKKLVAAGIGPASPMHVYRGQVLCLHVRSIGEAAGLRVIPDTRGRPVFARRKAKEGLRDAA